MELVPQPLANLIRRAERERERGTVFDLPLAKMWKGTPDGLDFSRSFHGERAANVVGPAAGPHTQLAQNIALSYLAGSRILELKTVQIMDELEIPRPCIDAANIGFNVEWSQELKIEQSTLEYAKAALLIAALDRMGIPEGLPPGDRDYLLDLSLGYSLEGIRSERVTGFVKSMLDATTVLDRLREELPANWRDLEVAPRLISCVTLSTFHGCPAGEIESIARYLLEELGVHTVVKLNPTLLGYEEVKRILNEELGYSELHVEKRHFDHDLQWDQALAMIDRLQAVAKTCGLMFGVKLTNTLVVRNHKQFFPATEKEMYLSGQPLHVLSTQLYQKIRTAIPHPIAYSFSAGIDQHNFPLAAAADLCPVTTCTDLLRPGGYARLPKYLDNLAAMMKACGAINLDELIAKKGGGDAAARQLAEAAITDPRYRKERNVKTPKKIGSTLELFDCVNCDKCIPVCPNDANFSYEITPLTREAPTWRFSGGGVEEVGRVSVEIEEGHQLATFVDFCNACGNCDVFCPEDGGPYVLKPHWFGSKESFEAETRLEGFYLSAPGRIEGRFGGRRVRLEVDGERAIYQDGVVRLVVSLANESVRLLSHQMLAEVPEHRVDAGHLVVMSVLARGVLSTVNPVSAAFD
jgi:putative selenate reductase